MATLTRDEIHPAEPSLRQPTDGLFNLGRLMAGPGDRRPELLRIDEPAQAVAAPGLFARARSRRPACDPREECASFAFQWDVPR